MDGPIEFDIDQLHDSLRSVDHALIRLTPVGIGQRLLIDFRSNDHAGPAVLLLPEVRSLAERIKSIEQARSEFPSLERIHVITWPLRVGALERLGVIETLRARLAGMDAFRALKQLDAAYARLLQLEQEEQRRAVSGEGYRTLWPPVRRP